MYTQLSWICYLRRGTGWAESEVGQSVEPDTVGVIDNTELQGAVGPLEP